MLKRVSSLGKRCDVYVILYSMSNLRDITLISLTQMDRSELTAAGPVEHAQIHHHSPDVPVSWLALGLVGANAISGPCPRSPGLCHQFETFDVELTRSKGRIGFCVFIFV
jgi:hypothetical protein